MGAFGQSCFNVIDPSDGSPGETEGCVNFFVQVKKCPDLDNITTKYCFDLPKQYVQLTGGGFPDSIQPQTGQIPDSVIINRFFSPDTHTYNVTGDYIIAQFINYNKAIYLKKIRVFDPTVKPVFTWEVCGKKIKINLTDPVFSQYYFSPGDGNPDELITGKSHEYTYSFTQASATFTFSIKGEKPSTCNRDPVPATVTLYQNPSPPVPILLEGPGTDTLSYRVQIAVRADEEYGFQQATGIADFSGLIGSGRQEEDAPVLNLDLPSLNGNDLWNSRFRSVTKKCYNGADQIEPSPQYWTIFWPRCQSENQKITINWPSLNIPGLVKFQLLRDGAVLTQPDPASAKFIDSADLICGSIYTYRFRTEVALAGGGFMIFLSPEVKASAISNRPPDPVQNITASVLSSVMEIKAEPSPIARLYHLFRKESEGGSYAEIGNGFSSLPIRDETASPNEKAYCYRISFDDVCGNRSLLSDVICPILLKVEKEEGVRFLLTGQRWKAGKMVECCDTSSFYERRRNHLKKPLRTVERIFPLNRRAR